LKDQHKIFCEFWKRGSQFFELYDDYKFHPIDLHKT